MNLAAIQNEISYASVSKEKKQYLAQKNNEMDLAVTKSEISYAMVPKEENGYSAQEFKKMILALERTNSCKISRTKI